MSSGEKKIAAILVVVLIAAIGAYFALGSRMETGQVTASPNMAGAGGPGDGRGGGYAETSSLGSEDAKVKIIALVPIANPCHAATVSALKEVYEAHPNDIHLTLIDFQGPHAAEWRQKLRVTCATVDINGQYTFDLDGRNVTFQKQEGGTYQPADLRTVVEAELEKAG